MSGLKGSISKIRLVHPSETPLHQHADEEQAVIMLRGSMNVTIDQEIIKLNSGDVCIIPAGVNHRFCSIEGEAEFLETFSPGRIQNLVGFLGKIF